MALVVNTNITSLIAHRQLEVNTTNVQRSMERLSSGLRINRAADDAAGKTISENLTGQIKGNQQALRNAQDGISILQIAEGSLSVVLENLQRMRELAVQAANDTTSQQERDAVALEMRRRAEDIERIAQGTQFNSINLLDGSAAGARLQVGANSNLATDTIDITAALGSSLIDAAAPDNGIGVINSGGGTTFASLNDIFNLGTGTSPVLTTGAAARSFLDDLDAAINTVTDQLANIGSFQNQLESVVSNLQIAVENFSASNSRIKDLDVAAESSKLIQSQILQQSSVSILSQANTIPQQTLQLLQN